MTVINNATLILKDNQGNEGIVKSFTDKDITKISNAITDVGQVVDPVTHMPIEATTESVGVVQLATAQDITNGTAGKVIDAQELNNFAQTLPAANGITVSGTAPNVSTMPVASGVMHPSQDIITENLDVSILALQQNLWAYDSTRDYAVGSYVFDENKDICKCIQANGPTNIHAPSDSAYWLRVATEDFVNTSINNLNIIKKNNGNDYYDDSDITSLIYAGNGAGTLRAQIAQGDFRNVHPGDYIIGKSTGTKWIVAHNDYWFNRGDSPLTRHHLCLIPEILAGNSGNLLWSGRTYAGSGDNNTTQGYAPWASDNWSEGKNSTSGAYYNSFIKQSILPKVYTYWLKKDFEDQGISLLTFRNLLSNATNTNAPVKSYSDRTGASSSWAWYDSKCDLLSEANVYGNNHWQSSGFDCGAQKEQFALFKFRHTLEVWGRRNVWFQDVAASPIACLCYSDGGAGHYYTSNAFLVAPFCLIA